MAGSKQIAVMMKELGWGSGFKLPIANDENRRLEELLEAKQSKLVSLSLEVQEVTGAIDNAAMFTKNLHSKLRHAKDVEAAKRGQWEQEKALVNHVIRDRKRIEEDIKKMKKQLESLQESNKLRADDLLRRKDDLGGLVDIINFDKEAIAAYETKFTKEDAYMSLIEELKDADEETLEKCRSEYQRLGEEVAVGRHRLDRTILDTSIMEAELQELAKRFRKAHASRNQSIEVWKRTLDVLESCDQEIMDLSKAHCHLALTLKEKDGILEKQEQFLSTVQTQTKEYKYQTETIERRMTLMSQRKGRTKAELDDHRAAVRDLLVCISATDREMRLMQASLGKMTCENDYWQKKLDSLTEDLERLRTKYAGISKEKVTSEEHTKQLNEFLEVEEKKRENLTRDLTKQTSSKVQREMQLKQLTQQIMDVDHKSQCLKNAIAQSSRKYENATEFFMRKNAIFYRLDLKATSLLMKIERLQVPSNPVDNPEYLQTQQEISSLKKTLEEQLNAEKTISAHLKHLNQVASMCQNDIRVTKKLTEECHKKVESIGIETKRIAKEGSTCDETRNEITVRNSLLQVQLRRMTASILEYESKLFDLEQERLTMKLTVKERKIDIEKQSTLLRLLKHELIEECLKTSSKCRAINQDINNKKRRYEAVKAQMWAITNSAGGEEKVDDASKNSEAYYIIKAAQEREMYRKEGDKWDERVKEAEKVLEGLQNTLALLVNTNEVFKESLKPATEETDEGRKLKQLKEKELEMSHTLKVLKEERESKTKRLAEIQLKLDKLLSVRNEHEHHMMEQQYELQKLILELKGQQEKIDRATVQANRLVKKLSELESLDVDLLQADLRLRVTREKYEYAVRTVEKLLQAFPELEADTIDFLQSKGLMDLASRLIHKSAGPTPFQSGRATPVRNKLLLRVKSTSRAGDPRNQGSVETISVAEYQAMRMSEATKKSIVFHGRTSDEGTQHMLHNIRKTIQKSSERPSATASAQHSRRSTNTLDNAGAISFGDLRKALHQAVQEQKLETRKDSNQDDDNGKAQDNAELSRGTPQTPPREVVELPDNQKRFQTDEK